MELAEIIGQNIKNYRQKFGYKQDYIANYLGIDRSTLSKYESAEREISLIHLNKLADIFGIELENLIEENADAQAANLSFAFRSEGINEQDIESIATFQKVVKNYIKMVKLTNETN